MQRKKGAVIFLLILIILGLLLGMFMSRGEGEQELPEDDIKSGGVGLQVDPNAGEYVEPEKDTTPSKGVAIPGWGSITIPANSKVVQVKFENPEANKDFYYLTFELRLLNNTEKGYEVLYKSQLVPPGQCIQNIELSKALTAGEYDAIVHVQPYKMDEAKTPTNNADMKTKLIVK